MFRDSCHDYTGEIERMLVSYSWECLRCVQCPGSNPGPSTCKTNDLPLWAISQPWDKLSLIEMERLLTIRFRTKVFFFNSIFKKIILALLHFLGWIPLLFPLKNILKKPVHISFVHIFCLFLILFQTGLYPHHFTKTALAKIPFIISYNSSFRLKFYLTSRDLC